MLCDVEMNNLAPLMSEQDKYVQDSKSSRVYREEINGDQIRYMIVEKSSPGLRRRFPDANHVFRYGSLRNVDPQLAQLAMYSRCPPTDVLS